MGALAFRRVLEFDTFAGYGMLWMARALLVDGKGVTLFSRIQFYTLKTG